jgi:hypothetical protein
MLDGAVSQPSNVSPSTFSCIGNYKADFTTVATCQ